jgi:glyoxylase I family protein
MPSISAIHHVSLTVSDIDRSVCWYAEVLGLADLMEEAHPDDSGYAVVLGKPDWSMCVGGRLLGRGVPRP